MLWDPHQSVHHVGIFFDVGIKLLPFDPWPKPRIGTSHHQRCALPVLNVGPTWTNIEHWVQNNFCDLEIGEGTCLGFPTRLRFGSFQLPQTGLPHPRNTIRAPSGGSIAPPRKTSAVVDLELEISVFLMFFCPQKVSNMAKNVLTINGDIYVEYRYTSYKSIW